MRYLKIVAAAVLFLLALSEQAGAGQPGSSASFLRGVSGFADLSLDHSVYRDWRRLPDLEKFPRQYMAETF